MNHPTQPVILDEDNRFRFKANPIVRKLLEVAKDNGYGLNEIARGDWEREDYLQLMQLIGYSLNGYAELSCVTSEDMAVADALAESEETEEQIRIRYLQGELAALREVLREPMARLFGIHPDDLARR